MAPLAIEQKSTKKTPMDLCFFKFVVSFCASDWEEEVVGVEGGPVPAAAGRACQGRRVRRECGETAFRV